jgi:hypothetical protein
MGAACAGAPLTPPLGAGQQGLWYTGSGQHGVQGFGQQELLQAAKPSEPSTATTERSFFMDRDPPKGSRALWGAGQVRNRTIGGWKRNLPPPQRNDAVLRRLNASPNKPQPMQNA